MTVSNINILKANFAINQALGDTSVQSDSVMVIEGFETHTPLLKSFPWPVLSAGDMIEIPLPLGQTTGQPAQIKTHQQGAVVIRETVFGHTQDMLTKLAGKKFNATIYEGTPEAFTRGVKIRDAFFVMDPSDRDMESRTAITQYSGTLHYNFFGETVSGNIRGGG